MGNSSESGLHITDEEGTQVEMMWVTDHAWLPNLVTEQTLKQLLMYAERCVPQPTIRSGHEATSVVSQANTYNFKKGMLLLFM